MDHPALPSCQIHWSLLSFKKHFFNNLAVLGLLVAACGIFLAVILFIPAAAAAKSLQSCPTMCDPIDGSPPGSPVPGILQARTLEWVAIFFSSA